MTAQSPKTVVLGLGNTLHGDDGVGPRAAQKLRSDKRLPEGVTVIDGGTLGLELLPYIWDCSRLLVLDSVEVGEPAGTIVRMSGEELSQLARKASVHQLGVADLLVALRMLAEPTPEIVLLGVQADNTEWSTEFSAQVQGSLEGLVEAAVEELQGKTLSDALQA